MNRPLGAVDFRECPFTRGRGYFGCQCGRCGVCGFQKHTGIHGPIYGKPPGSQPVGHAFVKETEPPHATP